MATAMKTPIDRREILPMPLLAPLRMSSFDRGHPISKGYYESRLRLFGFAMTNANLNHIESKIRH